MQSKYTALMIFLTSFSLRAASMDVAFSPGNAKSDPDNRGSVIISGQSTRPVIKVTLQGRGYAFPDDPRQTFGLGVGTFQGRPVFELSQGLPPDRAGSTVYHQGRPDQSPASYLAFRFENVAPGTLFQGVKLEFSDLNFVRSSRAWAGTSADGFSLATAFNMNTSGQAMSLTITLPDFREIDGGTTEVRLYGVYGVDSGNFSNVRLAGNILAPVPEPSALLLTGLAAGASCFRRRRAAMTCA